MGLATLLTPVNCVDGGVSHNGTQSQITHSRPAFVMGSRAGKLLYLRDMVLRRGIGTFIVACILWSPASFAGSMSTYLQGTVIKKSPDVWVVQTTQGTYWINVHRHPSYTRKLSEIETGFWVLLKDIKRFRPNVETAANHQGANGG